MTLIWWLLPCSTPTIPLISLFSVATYRLKSERGWFSKLVLPSLYEAAFKLPLVMSRQECRSMKWGHCEPTVSLHIGFASYSPPHSCESRRTLRKQSPSPGIALFTPPRGAFCLGNSLSKHSSICCAHSCSSLLYECPSTVGDQV